MLMVTANVEQERPSEKDVEQMWKELQVEKIPFQHPALDRLLENLRATHVNGGAEFALFQLSDHPVWQWFASRNKLDEIKFFEQFITIPAVVNALPSLEIKDALPSPLNLKQDNSAFTFDGELAKVLAKGGAYKKFKGTEVEAKSIGVQFCDALFGDRYNDVQIYVCHDAWSDWFGDVAWDITWFGVDKGKNQIWLLCVTDTD